MYDSLVLPASIISDKRLLEDWQWLLKAPHQVLVVTKMGDAFVKSPSSAVLFLDTLEGNVKEAARDERSFNQKWAAGDLDPTWFNPDMVALLEGRGVRLAPDQCYSYIVPPAIGGSFESSNIRVLRAVFHFLINGQLHRQVKELPAGTRITGLDLKE